MKSKRLSIANHLSPTDATNIVIAVASDAVIRTVSVGVHKPVFVIISDIREFINSRLFRIAH
jgi:hypothetical protein